MFSSGHLTVAGPRPGLEVGGGRDPHPPVLHFVLHPAGVARLQAAHSKQPVRQIP